MLQLSQEVAKQQLHLVKAIHTKRLSINMQRSMVINRTYHDSASISSMRTVILIFILIFMLIYTTRAILERTKLIFTVIMLLIVIQKPFKYFVLCQLQDSIVSLIVVNQI